MTKQYSKKFKPPDIKQARYWTFTQPVRPKDGAFGRDKWTEDLPRPNKTGTIAYIAGQCEIGETGYRHWQCIVYYNDKKTRQQVKRDLPFACDVNPTGYEGIERYISKKSTAVDGTFFEDGVRPGSKTIRRKEDYEQVWHCAITGDEEFSSVPADIRVRCFHNLIKIRSRYRFPTTGEWHPKYVRVYWGDEDTGKTRRAYDEALYLADGKASEIYVKDALTKWWNDYEGQLLIIIDEFTPGTVNIARVLGWTGDRDYKIESKGGFSCLPARPGYHVWITSNYDPVWWYNEERDGISTTQRRALLRRITEIVHFEKNGYKYEPTYYGPENDPGRTVNSSGSETEVNMTERTEEEIEEDWNNILNLLASDSSMLADFISYLNKQ